MQPSKMKKQLSRVLWLLPLILMITIAGCSSSDSSGSYTRKVYIVGEIQPPSTDATGEMAEQTKNVFVNRVAYDGVSTDAPIFIAAGSVSTLGDTVKAGILVAFLNYQPIIVINGGEKEINAVLGILGLPEDYTLPTGMTYAEMFAIDHQDGNIFNWSMYPPREVTITTVDGTTKTVTDSVDAQRQRLAAFRNWMANEGARLTAVSQSYRQTASSELVSAASDDSSSLTSVADGYVKTFNYSVGKNIYQFSYWIYSCHSFSSSDGVEYDWFYVRQEGEFNASGEYHFYEWYNNYMHAAIDYYIGKYSMDNWIQGWASSDSGVKLIQSAPQNDQNKTKHTSNIEYDISGSLGFSGKSLTGKVDGGIKIKDQTEVDLTDCQVANKSLDNYINAKWEYSFNEVGQTVYIGYGDLTKPYESARGNFQPRNHWIWRTTPLVRDSSNGQKFKSKFNVEKIFSKGGQWYFYWTFSPPEHHHEAAGEFEMEVPLTYPPVLVVSHNMDFTAEEGYQATTITVARDWTASSNQSWCTLDRTSGTKANTTVYITVEKNTTGASRSATVGFKTADGKAEDKMTVYQSQY